MTVRLDIFRQDHPDRSKLIAQIWDPFRNHVEGLWKQNLRHQGLEPRSIKDPEEDFDAFLVSHLERYGAQTDLKDEDDPLWFKDQESLTEFVLTWSK